MDDMEPRIRDLLREFPQMPATVIAERIGWHRSLTVLKERVRLLRPVYAPQDPASRTTYDPGEVGQCDLWFPPAQIPLGHGQVGTGKTAPPVLVLTAGYSRFLAATMIPTRRPPLGSTFHRAIRRSDESGGFILLHRPMTASRTTHNLDPDLSDAPRGRVISWSRSTSCRTRRRET